MKKTLLFFLLVILMTSGALFLAFTPSGNALFLPYINSYLKESVEGAKVELVKLELQPDSVSAVAKVNDSIDVVAKGPVDLMEQSFDLTYTVDAKKIEGPAFAVDTPLHVQGDAKGTIEDMQITGSGEAFASNIRYDLVLQNNQPKNITLNIVDASIAEILALAGEKLYAKGRMSVEVNMPTLDPENPQGEARLKIKDAVLDSALINQDFNVTLPAATEAEADITAKTQGQSLLAEGRINSSLGELTLSEANYHLVQKRLDTKYRLDIPDLARLKSLTPVLLGGKLKMEGEALYDQEKIHATGVSHSLGGKSEYLYRNDTLTTTLTNVEASKLLTMLGQPNYARGKVTANIVLDSLKALSGKFDLRSSGSANSAVVKKELDLNLGKKFNYSAVSSGKINKRRILARTTLDTTMAKLSMPDITYDMPNAKLRSSYHLLIADLGKLQPITKRRFRGDMDFRGGVTYGKNLVITGNGKEFDGSVSYKFVNSHVRADVTGATVSKVMYMLGYPQVLEALTEATVDYDLKTGRGWVDAKLDTAKFLNTKFTFLLKQLLKIDLTREFYTQATFKSSITPARFGFDFNAENPVSHIKIKKGTLDRRNDSLNVPVDMRYKDREIKAKIRGTLKNPKVTLDTSAYLKSKIEDKVGDLFGDKLKGKGEGGEENIKDLFGGKLKGKDKGGEEKIKELFKGFLKR